MKAVLYDDGSIIEMPDSIMINISSKEVVDVAQDKNKEEYNKKLKSLTEKGKSIKSK